MGHSTVLVQDLMAAGRTDVLDLAIRKLEEREGDEAGDELNWVLLVAAEGAAIGPSGWAELVALAVALPAGDVPDGEALGRGLIKSGALPDSEELRLLPGWRSPDALAELSFGAVRRVLLTWAMANHRATCRPVTRMSWPGGVSGCCSACASTGPSRSGRRLPPVVVCRKSLTRMLRRRPMRYVGLLCSTVGEAASSRRARAACHWMLWHFSRRTKLEDFLAEAGEQTGGLEEIRG